MVSNCTCLSENKNITLKMLNECKESHRQSSMTTDHKKRILRCRERTLN